MEFKFLMTAIIKQVITIDVDPSEVPEGMEIEDYAEQLANETWDYTIPTNDESFEQTCHITC